MTFAEIIYSVTNRVLLTVMLQGGLYKGLSTVLVLGLRLVLRLTWLCKCERFHELQAKQRGPLEPEVRMDVQKKCTCTSRTSCLRRIAVWEVYATERSVRSQSVTVRVLWAVSSLDVRTLCDHRLFVKCFNTLPDFRGENALCSSH